MAILAILSSIAAVRYIVVSVSTHSAMICCISESEAYQPMFAKADLFFGIVKCVCTYWMHSQCPVYKLENTTRRLPDPACAVLDCLLMLCMSRM